jgi:hypothetical protein
MRANDMPRVAAFAKDTERFGNMVFLPASIAVLILGSRWSGTRPRGS